MSSSGGWRWDYNSNQRVKWSKKDGCYVNESGKRVKNPNFDPPSAAVSLPRGIPAASSSSRTHAAQSIQAEPSSSRRTQDEPSSSRRTQAEIQPYGNYARTSSGDVSRTAELSSSFESRFQQLALSSTSTSGKQTSTNLPRSHTAVDPTTGAATRWDLSQTTQASGSTQQSWNLKRVLELEGRRDQNVVVGYAVSKHPQTDFRTGRVIEVILVPPQLNESSVSGITPNESATHLPRRAMARMRRFVIIRENVDGRNTFQAIAIKTYNGQGVAAPGVIKSHHAIIYTGTPPQLTPREQPQRMRNGLPENGVLPQPIRVVPYDRGTALDPLARLDYGDLYLFEAGVPNIRIWGRVHVDSHAPLFVQFTQVWAAIQQAATGAVPVPGAVSTAESTTTEVQSRRVDPTSADSGPITDEEMRQLMRRYQEYADRNDLSMPEQRLNPAQMTALARDSQRRAFYLRRIRDGWAEEEEEDDDGEDDGEDDDDDED